MPQQVAEVWQEAAGRASCLAGPLALGLGLGRGLGARVAPGQGELDPWGIPHPLPWDRALNHGCMWTPSRILPVRSSPHLGDLEEKGVNLGGVHLGCASVMWQVEWGGRDVQCPSVPWCDDAPCAIGIAPSASLLRAERRRMAPDHANPVCPHPARVPWDTRGSCHQGLWDMGRVRDSPKPADSCTMASPPSHGWRRVSKRPGTH